MKIIRDEYLKQIVKFKDNGRVKIITGIRRCGKSFLLKELYKDYLLKNGIREDEIIILSLDDDSSRELLDPIELDSYIRNLVSNKDKRYYVFIDEIQNVYTILNPTIKKNKRTVVGQNDRTTIGFVQVVLGLMQIDNVDLYITGSNSKFLSKDIITEFRDRGDEIHVQPLSFKEYCQNFDKSVETLYEEYSLLGGMPRSLQFNEDIDKQNYLRDLYRLTYTKDILDKHKKKEFLILDKLTMVISSNIGSLINVNTIYNTFKSEMKIEVSKNELYNYLEELEDSYIIKKVNRYDIRGRKHIGALYKFYFTDVGLRNARLDFLHHDKGHIMENIIYNELSNRGFNVEVGVVESFRKNEENKTERVYYETDFIARLGSKTYYIQSAYEMLDDSKYQQESKSLTLINDSFKKIIVTRQSGPIRHDINGITIIGIIDFLLDKNSMDK